MSEASKPHSRDLREYADAVDKDRGFKSALTAVMRQSAKRIDDLEEQLESANEALRTYGEHLTHCERIRLGNHRLCSCGYEAAIQAALKGVVST